MPVLDSVYSRIHLLESAEGCCRRGVAPPPRFFIDNCTMALHTAHVNSASLARWLRLDSPLSCTPLQGKLLAYTPLRYAAYAPLSMPVEGTPRLVLSGAGGPTQPTSAT